MVSRTLVQVDAQNRAFRTFIQGLALDVAVAIAALVLVALPDLDFSSSDGWKLFGVSVAKTILTAVASYVMRLKVSPTPQTEGQLF